MLISARPLLLAAAFMAAACTGGSRSASPQSDNSSPPATAQSPAQPAAPPAAPACEAETAERDSLRDNAVREWKGDLDGMIERRVIRVLTTFSKVNYFVDAGTQRGLIYDAFRLFEDDLNKKLNSKHLRVYVVFIPMAHDQLVPALLAGKGDVVASGTLMTDWRKEQVDFTEATHTNVSSIIVSGPGVPPIKSPMDLGGREV